MSPSLPVTGLTLENAEAVGEALEALQAPGWACAACQREAQEPGTCCEAPREERRLPVLASAAANPAASSVAFLVAPGRSVSLTTLEAALAPLEVRLEPQRLHLAGRVTLVLDGAADAEAARAAAGALQAAGLFRQVDVESPEGGPPRLVVVEHSATHPELAEVRAALAAACPALRLTDVCWAGLPRA
jgi:hypothetical protein